MKTVMKIVLGIVIASVLLIGGCMALLGGAINEVDKEIDKQQAEHSITQEEFKSLKHGESLDAVIDRLGEPEDRQTMENEGLGKSVLIYYNVEGGELGDMYQITFTNGKLDGKNSY